VARFETAILAVSSANPGQGSGEGNSRTLLACARGAECVHPSSRRAAKSVSPGVGSPLGRPLHPDPPTVSSILLVADADRCIGPRDQERAREAAAAVGAGDWPGGWRVRCHRLGTAHQQRERDSEPDNSGRNAVATFQTH
jgi:hypothetical protein